jgi:hypothetical protein
VNNLQRTVTQIIQERKRSQDFAGDLLSLIMELERQPNSDVKFTDTELGQEVMTFLVSKNFVPELTASVCWSRNYIHWDNMDLISTCNTSRYTEECQRRSEECAS